MTHQEDLVDTQMVKQANKVTNNVERGVGGERGRGISVAISAEVGGDAAVAMGGQEEKLVAPWVSELRKAVEEEYDWACPQGRSQEWILGGAGL